MNSVTPLTHNYWVETMQTMMKHPSANETIRQLAEMVLNLIELNKFDPDTGAYLDSLGLKALEENDGTR